MSQINVLMYHQVGKFKNITTHKATYCDVGRFRSQLGLMKMYGYKSVTLYDIYLYLSGKKEIPEKSVVLTFDDGYENFYEYAFPALQEYGFSAIVYLVAGKIGDKADWLEKDGHFPAKLMNVQQIRELKKYGILFGSHGYDHLRLTQQEYYVAKNDIEKSKKVLEDLLGEEVKHFCYPYGDHNIEIMKITQDAGYLTGVTCERSSITQDIDPFAIPRKAVSFGDSILGFAWKLFFKNKPKRKLLSLYQEEKNSK